MMFWPYVSKHVITDFRSSFHGNKPPLRPNTNNSNLISSTFFAIRSNFCGLLSFGRDQCQVRLIFWGRSFINYWLG
jgi:hypothetical protein